MIVIPEDALLVIHKHALVNFIGAAVIALFFLFTLGYYLVSDRRKVFLSFMVLQVPLFLFLFGFSMYVSAQTLEQLYFWTRVCYSGMIMTVPAFYDLAYAIIGLYRRGTHWVLGSLTLVFLALLWSGELLVTRTVLPPSLVDHPALAKGPGFGVVFTVVMIILGGIIYHFIRHYRLHKPDIPGIYPIILGFSVWWLTSLHDGLSARFYWLHARPWIGPVFMVLMMGVSLSIFTNEYMKRLAYAMREKDEMYERAIRDPLTGIFNRSYLSSALEVELALSKKQQIHHSLLFIDMDNLKVSNDRFGHLTGDAMIKELTGILQATCRRQDVIARIGGDEFVVLLYQCNQVQAEQIALRVQARFDDALYNLVGNEGRQIASLSIGVLPSSLWDCDVDTILHEADQAMYAAKRSGKNKVVSATRGGGRCTLTFEEVMPISASPQDVQKARLN